METEKTAEDVALLKDARITILSKAVELNRVGEKSGRAEFFYNLDSQLAKAIKLITEPTP